MRQYAVPRDQRVADHELALLHEDGGHGPAALVEVGLEHRAAGAARRVALEVLQVGDHQQRLEQRVEVLVRLGGDVDELEIAAPLGRG